MAIEKEKCQTRDKLLLENMIKITSWLLILLTYFINNNMFEDLSLTRSR